MQTPIPEVPEAQEHIQKKRPAGLDTVTTLLCVSNLTGYLWVDRDPEYVWFDFTWFTTLITLFFVVFWYFWKGYDWARIVVLVCSVLVFGEVFYFAEFTFLQITISTADMIFSVYLLYWLNTKPIKEYFKQKIPAQATR